MPCGCRPTSYCSYACTAGSATALTSSTGILDRLFEAVAETSYGQLAFSWDVGLPNDTLWVPFRQPEPAGSNPFLYSDAPVKPFLEGQGINPDTDYHTIVVRSCRQQSW